MDAAIVMRLLSGPFKPFDLITVSGHEYLVEDAQHCRLFGDHTVFVWSQSGDVELIDLKLVERVRINENFSFSKFENYLKR